MKIFDRICLLAPLGLILLAVSPPDYFPRKFEHPGLLLTDMDIESLRNGLASREAYVAYRKMLSDRRSLSNYVAEPTAVVEVGKFRNSKKRTFKNDAFAAYLNSLRWAVTGDREALKKAILIMDNWARTFEGFEVVAGTPKQSELEAAWILPIWAGAAEIVRYNAKGASNWPAGDADRFGRFLDRLVEYARAALNHKSNWGVSAANGMLAAAVFNNDTRLYKEGMDNLKRLLPVIIRDDGEPRELRARDCNHPQYSLIAFVQAAEVASNQNDESLWSMSNTRGDPVLASGLRYIGASLQNGQGTRDCRGKSLQPGYGWTALKHYMKLGIDLENFESVTRRDPTGEGTSFEFIGWSGLTN